jgi:signal transduction histidine kinase
LAISLLLAALFAGFSISSRATSDQQLLEAIAPYLSTLVESQDRPEILRVFQSISESRGTQFVLVQDKMALASTRSISEMDRSFADVGNHIFFLGSQYTAREIVSARMITRQGGPALGATIYSLSPLGPVVLSALLISAIAFFAALAISFLSAVKMKAAVNSALAPLEQLREEIQAIGSETSRPSSSIPIRELEDIRRAIFQSKVDLANARERLAEERAKKLSAASFKSLIHDLHNPVAALRQWLRLWTDPAASPSVREEAARMVPQIADEILRQVGAAKRNLESEPEVLREFDLRECLKASLSRVQSAAGLDRNLSIEFPDRPVVVAHDPDLLQRAVVNLLENGIEASRSKVALSLEQSGKMAIVRVSDDGVGMSESDLPIFLQGRGKSKRADREALGLSSANHIVRTHGGKIVYSKNSMGGATFEIRLEAR